MKNIDKKSNKQNLKNRFKNIILGFVLILVLFTPFIYIKAEGGLTDIIAKPLEQMTLQTLPGLPSKQVSSLPKTTEAISNSIWDYIVTIARIMYKNGLSYFLQRIAYDTATYLASGDKGQQPLYWQEGFGKYIAEVGDEAFANELDSFSRGVFGVSLCEPNNLDIKLGLILDAKKVKEPRRANCTFNKIAKNKLFNVTVNGRKVVNLSKMQMKDFKYLANYFNPNANELGAGLELKARLRASQAKNEELARTERELSPLAKDLKDAIGSTFSKKIKTPGWLNALSLKKSVEDSNRDFFTLTGDIAADALGTFFNTLTSKFLDRFKKGFFETYSGPKDFAGYGGGALGLRAAEATYSNFFVSEAKKGGELSILGTLGSCPTNEDQRLFNNCIIDRRFATAIEQKMTVREAIEKGYLDLKKPFGYLANGNEPKYDNGYPYSSLVFLRKYRIIPVTWELAALYARKFTNDVKTLADVMGTPDNDFAVFNSPTSPFYHLIDPDWVLKIPRITCRAKGPGPQILVNEPISVPEPDPDNPGEIIDVQKTMIQRADYCADEVSCIKENEDGSCSKQGYCTKEREIWKFGGESCQPYASSCQTMQTNGKKYSYLAKTLASCDSSQADCAWYSAYKTADGEWANDIWNENTAGTSGAGSAGSDGKITFNDVFARQDLGDMNTVDTPYNYVRYFNNRIKKCSSRDQGCNKFLALTSIVPPKGYDPTVEAIYKYVQTSTTPAGDLVYADSGYFDSYGEWAKVNEKYIKTAPPNLNCPLDLSDPKRDPECDRYAQQCRAQDVGCALYTPENGDPPVPAVVKENDYCSAECVGYDQYLEVATYFEKRSDSTYEGERKDLIPTTAKSCRAENVGCERFTNLDEAKRGGESIEYYSYLRECIVPDNPASGTYYTWEGSDTAGYQLKTWKLKISTNASGQIVLADGPDPNGGCEAGNPDCCTLDSANPSCRQFLDSEGNTWNRNIDTVIFASEDCHPYRREIGNELIYGMKSLSNSCPARENGCHEYRGNNGNTVMMLINDDFESGTTDGWIEGQNSSVSVYVGGHSLLADAMPIAKRVENSLSVGKNYTLSFWAKSHSGNPENVTWQIQSYTDDDPSFPIPDSIRKFCSDQTDPHCGQVTVGSEWQYFRLGPVKLDRALAAQEKLETSTRVNVYFDNIILREVTDSYYLIKDSWETPASCDEPFLGAQVGCQAYRDNSGQSMNLLGFTQLCPAASVGCQAFINTYNTDSPFAKEYNMETGADFTTLDIAHTLTIPKDDLIFLVDDKKKYCNAKFVGCQAFGKAIVNRQSEDREVIAFSDQFLLNNPEKYNQTLCDYSGLYCKEYQVSQGDKKSVEYYIDPGNRVCEYRANKQGEKTTWYKQGTDEECVLEKVCSNDPNVSCSTDSECRCAVSSGNCKLDDPTVPNPSGECDSTGEYCTQDSDCASGCKIPHSDILLSEDNNNGICIAVPPAQPTYFSNADNYDGWVATCSEKYSGCSQFIDPEAPHVCTNDFYKTCQKDEDCQGLYDPRGNNNESDGVCRPNDNASYYYLQQTVDKNSCNGIVNRRRGCLLFNQTNIIPQAYTYSGWDSSLTQDGQAPKSSTIPQYNDSNVIVKVNKDRVCDEWLSCTTKVKAKDKNGNTVYKCLGIGLCDRLNDQNQCSRMVKVKTKPDNTPLEIIGQQVYGGLGYSGDRYTVEDLRYMSGFTKAGMTWINFENIKGVCSNDNSTECKTDSECFASGAHCVIDNTIPGYVPYSYMQEIGNVSDAVKNGSFEKKAPITRHCELNNIECSYPGDPKCEIPGQATKCDENNQPLNSDTCNTCVNMSNKKYVCENPIYIASGNYNATAIKNKECDSTDTKIVNGSNCAVACAYDVPYSKPKQEACAGPCVEKTIGNCSIDTATLCAQDSDCPNACKECNPCVKDSAGSPFADWRASVKNSTEENYHITADHSKSDNQDEVNYVDGEYTAHLKIDEGSGDNDVTLVQDLQLTPGEYVLSGSVSWNNVGSDAGNAYVAVKAVQGTQRLGQFYSNKPNSGNDNEKGETWEKFSFRFANNRYLAKKDTEIRLGIWQAGHGEAYFDNIRIEPALKLNNPQNKDDEVLVGQTCRMYPRADAKSCNVTVKSGKGKGVTYWGWPGYCVEPDPKNPQYCLHWWPVDGVRGSRWATGEKILNFSEKTPLYYCLQAKGNESSPANSSFTQLNYRSEQYDMTAKIIEPYPQYYTHSKYEYIADKLNIYLGSPEDADNGDSDCFANDSKSSILCDNDAGEDNWDGPFYAEYGRNGKGESDRKYVRCEKRINEGINENRIGQFSFGACPGDIDEEDEYEKHSILLDMYNAYYRPEGCDMSTDGGGCMDASAGNPPGTALPETQLYDWEIESIELVRVTASKHEHYPGWIILDRNTRYSPYTSGKYKDPENWWYVDCYGNDADTHCDGGKRKTTSNALKFGVWFENHHPSRYYIEIQNKWDHDVYDVGYKVIYHLREPCLVLARTAKDVYNMTPYWNRVQGISSFTVTSTPVKLVKYEYETDSAPFGSAYQSGIKDDESDPETWDSDPQTSVKEPLYVYGPSPLTGLQNQAFSLITKPGPIRAGTPYACQGICAGDQGNSVCVGGKENGNYCNNEPQLADCYQGDAQSGGSGGVCVGAPEAKKQVNNKDVDFAKKSLEYLFAKSYGIWNWQNDRYHKLPDYWDDTNTPYDGYHIQNPKISNVKIDNKTIDKIIKGGGGTVEFSFTTDIADEQLPLRAYTIDWGDGATYILPTGNYQERPNPNDPHLYYHTYAYDLMNCDDSSARCQATECTDDNTGEKHKCKTLNITVEVTDNWDKSSTAQSAQIEVWE